MQFKPFEAGIEAYGASIDAIVEAFKLFPSVALRRLAAVGIGTMTGKNDIVIERDAWYPQDKFLAAFESIATEVGPRGLFQFGQHVPKYAPFPPTITDIHSALGSVDVAYHMNHRKNGKVMFNPATGQMLEGIGHYGYKAVPRERRIVSVCENPYPCDFDRGLISGLATRFEKFSRVTHDDSAPCRKNGANSCTYVITW
jgi:hypothetical protein